MQLRDRSYLMDILKAAQLVQAFVANMNKEQFDADLKT